jgi:peptidylamidoglycolate lyase
MKSFRAIAVSAPLMACLWLAVSMPLASLAQAVPSYQYVPEWPTYNGDAARIRRNEITGVATDAAGRVYLCQATRYPVMVFDRSGSYLGSWGWPTTTEPHSIRIDPEGNFWLPDLTQQQVYKFSPDGRLIFALGVKRKKGRTPGFFSRPCDVAFGNGIAYIADGYNNSRIVRYTLTGQYLGEWGGHGSDPGEFRVPHSIAVDGTGLVYVADRENRRVQVFTPDGSYVRHFNLAEKPFGLFITPQQRLFICFEYPCTIGVYDLFGNQMAYWGGVMKGRVPGNLADPHMLCVDDQGALYVAELRGHRVQKFVPR